MRRCYQVSLAFTSNCPRTKSWLHLSYLPTYSKLRCTGPSLGIVILPPHATMQLHNIPPCQDEQELIRTARLTPDRPCSPERTVIVTRSRTARWDVFFFLSQVTCCPKPTLAREGKVKALWPRFQLNQSEDRYGSAGLVFFLLRHIHFVCKTTQVPRLSGVGTQCSFNFWV